MRVTVSAAVKASGTCGSIGIPRADATSLDVTNWKLRAHLRGLPSCGLCTHLVGVAVPGFPVRCRPPIRATVCGKSRTYMSYFSDIYLSTGIEKDQEDSYSQVARK
jgi:hypothetical protein